MSITSAGREPREDFGIPAENKPRVESSSTFKPQVARNSLGTLFMTHKKAWRMGKGRVAKWKPGQYEGLTPEQVQAQIGTAVKPPSPGPNSSVGMTFFDRAANHHGKGCMK